METKVLTQEELTKLTNLQNQQNDLILNLGSIEYRMSLLVQNKEILKAQVLELEKLNNELGQQLTEKYGKYGFEFSEEGLFLKDQIVRKEQYNFLRIPFLQQRMRHHCIL